MSSSCVFICSDQHFGHQNLLNFKGPDGIAPLRPFTTIEEHDETLIENHNKVVGKNDLVYFLGDVTMHPRALPIVARLNGKKRLVKGNHDTAPLSEYCKYFDDIYGVKVMKEMILSHVPLSKESLGRFGTNVHGHLHAHTMNDPQYICVSMEQINYTPISLEDVRKIIKMNKEVLL